MSHPASCTDPACSLRYVEHLRTINVSPSATPSRAWNRTPGQPDEPIAATEAREKRWAKDMPAYKRLRQAGHKAPLDGAAAYERTLQ